RLRLANQSGSPASTNAAQKWGDAYGRSLSPPAGIAAETSAGGRALAPLPRATPPESSAVRARTSDRRSPRSQAFASWSASALGIGALSPGRRPRRLA